MRIGRSLPLLAVSVCVPLAIASISAAPAAGRTTATAAATSKTPVTAPPVQGETRPTLDINLDTVLGGGTTATELKEPLTDCTQTSLIHLGQLIVFRMWGVDVQAGGVALTEANVPEDGAYISIKNVKVGSEMTTLRAPFAWTEESEKRGPKFEPIGAKHSYWEVPIPSKGSTSGADIGWKTESASGALAEIKEGTAIEIPPTSPAPVEFTVHVTTKPFKVTKTVTEQVKVTVTKHGKRKTVSKTVKKKLTVREPSVSGEASWASFDVSSQLTVVSP